ncbi:DNA-binding response regulator [Desulfopila sp. IMCC35008]|uniref:DNA-binding response regulator n=1 Tax=Desulfopila sp. IMCC35008 TaxID=2653858 RepID=UPI0013D697AC|nr:DNA-binding response regulator [Desulfopila sp. IMCC35008]
MNNNSILLVDDDESILVSLSWILEKNSFKVTTAQSGLEALDLLRVHRYNVIITDLQMGEIGGLEVLQEAKKISYNTGVIVLTGYADIDSAVETFTCGADDYLNKPCDTDELIFKVRRTLEKQELTVRLREQNELLKQEIATRKQVESQLNESQTRLEQEVKKRTAELSATVDNLKDALGKLAIKEEELQKQNEELNAANSALNLLLKRRDRELREVREEVSAKTIEMALPLLKKAHKHATGASKSYLESAQANLLDISLTHSKDTLLVNAKLAPRELQVVNYIRQNKSSKEIADILDITVRTVESYRESIRKKIRLKNKKISLKKYLTSLP